MLPITASARASCPTASTAAERAKANGHTVFAGARTAAGAVSSDSISSAIFVSWPTRSSSRNEASTGS